MGEKPTTPFLGTTRAEGWTVFGICAPLAILIGVLFGEDRGWIAGDALGALGGLLVIAWPLRKERWYWVAFAMFAGANAFAVMHFDWSFTHDWSGHAMASLMIPDLAVMMAVTYGLYCLIYGTPSKAVAELPDEGPSYAERDLDL